MFGKRAIVHVRFHKGLKLIGLVLTVFAGEKLKQSLAFIATADIADEEELFLNYR